MNEIGRQSGVAATAVLGHNVIIMVNVVIGERTVIRNNVVIYPGTIIGDDVTIYDNTVLGRWPQAAGTLTRKLPDNLGPLVIQDECVIGAGVVLYAGSIIGKNCLICDLSSVREGCELEEAVVLGRGVMVNYNTRIGKRSRIMDSCHLTGEMVIEEDVFISTHVCTANDNYLGRSPKSVTQRRGPRIRRGASIGLNATILPGVEIGEGAIVGAGSVVTKDVPAMKVVMGVPARTVGDIPKGC